MLSKENMASRRDVVAFMLSAVGLSWLAPGCSPTAPILAPSLTVVEARPSETTQAPSQA
jgi:hypothetical protein